NILPELHAGQGQVEVYWIETIPGQSRSVAIGTQLAVAVIDDKVRRPKLGPPSASLAARAPGVLWGNGRTLLLHSGGGNAGPWYPLGRRFGLFTRAIGNQLVDNLGFVMPTPPDRLKGFLSAEERAADYAFHPESRWIYSYPAGGSDQSRCIEA